MSLSIKDRVAAELGIALTETVFKTTRVDTDAAAALGVTVHHYEGVAGLDVLLRSLTT